MSSDVAATGPWRWNWRRDHPILHHVVLAATLASVTLLAGRTSFFEPFDHATRSVITYFQAWRDESYRLPIMAVSIAPVFGSGR
ncbi:MAG: hypothetical protein HY294_14215 [Candidatus Rokubacteria bacterium]|nr:hypothetical protein [Candidatus Rokubacteria bacterium]MBI3827143.1 hypothetical protein [Candidatus Rokubacteria bacterium]